jgi:sugar/nucleoside kinase (ribokinase family)
LEKGRERGSFNTASVLSSEVNEFSNLGGFAKTDLLAVNIDEARSIAGITDELSDDEYVIDRCVEVLSKINPGLSILITRGPEGSSCYSENRMEYVPPLGTEAVGTGGAGDAFIAGVIVGICCGLSLLKGRNDSFFSETPLKSAVELGTLLASLSVTSPDTIHQGADSSLVYEYGKQKLVKFSEEFIRAFK